MGVCMTCPARVVAGTVDQSAGMLDDEVQEKGYALMCVASPLSDCTIKVIEEEELLDEVLQASKASSSG
jgi:ferredoxin